jgi:hypothetical protein
MTLFMCVCVERERERKRNRMGGGGVFVSIELTIVMNKERSFVLKEKRKMNTTTTQMYPTSIAYMMAEFFNAMMSVKSGYFPGSWYSDCGRFAISTRPPKHSLLWFLSRYV